MLKSFFISDKQFVISVEYTLKNPKLSRLSFLLAIIMHYDAGAVELKGSGHQQIFGFYNPVMFLKPE